MIVECVELWSYAILWNCDVVELYGRGIVVMWNYGVVELWCCGSGVVEL